MRVLVCGGRNYAYPERVQLTLSYYKKELQIECIIEGGAKGADTFAGEWADNNQIPRLTFPVTSRDWKIYGKRAGHIRNTKMLIEGMPNLVIAFPGGAGTKNMITQARKAKIKVIEVEE